MNVTSSRPSTVRRDKDQKLRAYHPAARLVPNIDVRGGIVHASWRVRELAKVDSTELEHLSPKSLSIVTRSGADPPGRLVRTLAAHFRTYAITVAMVI